MRKDPELLIRAGVEADLPAVLEIYQHYVLNALCTFEEVPPTLAELRSRRKAVLDLGLPYLVATLEGRLAGYAYAGSYRPRPAYRHTVEDSVYLAPDLLRRGIGRVLLGELVAQCAAGGFRQMIAVIGDSANAGSIRLHEQLGFLPVGVLRDVGFKFGRWVDTVLMQRALQPT
jgi:phosphinothricin acetyltransferase